MVRCRVSHEAIYQWVYVQPVSTLARELISLRTGRKARKGGRRPPPAPRIPGAGVHRRPARRGRGPRGAWTLGAGFDHRRIWQDRGRDAGRAGLPVPHPGAVDRTRLAHRGRRGHRRHPRPARADPPVADLGTAARRWRGTPRTPRSGSQYSSPNPHKPWERGSDENLIRVVREYSPKGVEITSDPTYLAMVASDINDRSRTIYNGESPSPLFAELVEPNVSTG